VYKSEIERIWKAQHDSLIRKDEPPLDVEEEEKKTYRKPSAQRQTSVGEFVMSPSVISPPAAAPSAVPSPALSRGSSIDRESMGPDSPRKALRIKRLVSNFRFECEGTDILCQVDGQWKIEIIRDVAVIHAYIKKRQVIDEEAQQTNTLAPTGDADKDARAKRRCLMFIAGLTRSY
jgi:transcription initiation factor TFIID subunit 1, fungi type